MSKYVYKVKYFDGGFLSASSLYGLTGLRSLILRNKPYFYNGSLVHRYINGVLDADWARKVQVYTNGVSFQHL